MEVAAFALAVAAIAGFGIVLGMIVAGRVDRLTTSAEAQPPPTPQEEQS